MITITIKISAAEGTKALVGVRISEVSPNEPLGVLVAAYSIQKVLDDEINKNATADLAGLRSAFGEVDKL